MTFIDIPADHEITVALAGAPGAPGPEGPQGPEGPTGPAGPPGNDGADGPVGPAGAEGPAGPQGPAGANGSAGPQGPAGPVGPAGLLWRGNWAAGTAYVPNDAVQDGGTSYFAIAPSTGARPSLTPASWAVLASQGSPGSDGAQGPPGPAGSAGAQGPPGAPSTVPGPAGPEGPQGPTGPQGPKGDKGDTGPAGPAGSSGAGGGDMYAQLAGYQAQNFDPFTGGNTTPASGVPYYSKCRIGTDCTVTKMAFSLSGAASSVSAGKSAVAIYRASDKGLVVQVDITPDIQSSGVKVITLPSTNLPAGDYYLCLWITAGNMPTVYGGNFPTGPQMFSLGTVMRFMNTGAVASLPATIVGFTAVSSNNFAWLAVG